MSADDFKRPPAEPQPVNLVNADKQGRTLRLIALQFQARYTSLSALLPHRWLGPNAALAMALCRWGDPRGCLEWPFRMSVTKLVGVTMTVGEDTYPPGDYPAGAPTRGSLWIPSLQFAKITGLDAGCEIHGELLIEPIVAPLDRQKGIIFETDPNADYWKR